jgi:3-oxoacyl-[acyl-carrier protein] reductase
MSDAGRLAGQVAVITGSSRGFGAEIARTFAREGAAVTITWYRDQEGEDELGRAVAAECGSDLAIPFDVRDRASVREVMTRTAEAHGRIDVLVNNAGVNRVGDFDQITDEMWDTVLDTNLKGPFLCCQEVLPHMPSGGRIVTVA